MRRVSFVARQAQEAQDTDEIEVLLVIIEHPDLEGGILRVCSDPAERITDDPLTYGTYSAWRDSVVRPFYFTMLEGLLPDEKDDSPTQASLVVAILDSDLGEVLTSTTVQATCHMAVVMASSPNRPEGEWLDMLLVDTEIDSGQVILRFSTEAIYDEPFPAARMTKDRFPGLHR